MYRRLVGSLGHCGWVQKISPSLWFTHWSVQHLSCHYTNFAILADMAHVWGKNFVNILVAKVYCCGEETISYLLWMDPHLTSIQSIFFVFYWRYNPLWVLAFSLIFFHSALSSHCLLHRLTPIICISSLMSAIYFFLRLPLVLIPIGFHSYILLGVLLSSIRITWPNQAILIFFINLTIFAFSISSFSS
jgi:hypothetical protein